MPENDHEQDAAEHSKGETVGGGKDNPRRNGMGIFMSTVLIGVGLLFIGIGANAWARGGYGNAVLAAYWGIAGYLVFGIGAGVTYYSYVIRPAKAAIRNTQQSQTQGEPFSVNVVTALGRDDRLLRSAGFWLSYGKICSPIHRMLFVQITNMQTVPSVIATYRVEVQKSDGTWIKLTRMDGRIGAVYHLLELKSAYLYSIDTLDAVISNRKIIPKETVEGWALFELPEDLPLALPIRVYVRDYGGAETTQVVSVSSISEDFEQTGGVRPLNKADLSQCKLMFYSDARREN